MEHVTIYSIKALSCFYFLIILLQLYTVGRGAPLLSTAELSTDSAATDAPGSIGNTTQQSSLDGSVAEQQGDEVADLQRLRSGLKVLNTITKNQLAVRLQLFGEDRTALDSVNENTGIRFALNFTCALKRSAEAFWRVPADAAAASNGTLSVGSANFTLLRTASDSLYKSSCLWVMSVYQTSYPNSTVNFSCNSCEAMTSICNSLDILHLTETLERQYYVLQSFILEQTHSDQWLKENIERESVLPEVYDIIYQQ